MEGVSQILAWFHHSLLCVIHLCGKTRCLHLLQSRLFSMMDSNQELCTKENPFYLKQFFLFKILSQHVNNASVNSKNKKLDSCIDSRQKVPHNRKLNGIPFKKLWAKNKSQRKPWSILNWIKMRILIYGHFMGHRESTDMKEIYNTKCIMHIRRKVSTR